MTTDTTHPIYATAAAASGTFRYVPRRDVAVLVRLALKRAYPDTKFWVRKSPGLAINVSYDGRAPGAPAKRDVDRLLAPFAGGGFDGMTDTSYGKNSWLLPDGSAALGRTSGTGFVAGYDNPAPSPDAILVSFGGDFIFVSDRGR